jgi:hypothetical protein
MNKEFREAQVLFYIEKTIIMTTWVTSRKRLTIQNLIKRAKRELSRPIKD